MPRLARRILSRDAFSRFFSQTALVKQLVMIFLLGSARIPLRPARHVRTPRQRRHMRPAGNSLLVRRAAAARLVSLRHKMKKA